MIGDQYEHYIPPRPEFQNRTSKFEGAEQAAYRFPAPGSATARTAAAAAAARHTQMNEAIRTRDEYRATPSDANAVVCEACAAVATNR